MTINDANKMLLTVPPEIETAEPHFLTGNEYISLPLINLNGGIASVNVISLEHRGLLEFKGNLDQPLIIPELIIDGANIFKEGCCRWQSDLDWIPSFTLPSNGMRINGSIVAPPGFKGFIYRILCINDSGHTVNLNCLWKGIWQDLCYTVFNSRRLDVKRSLFHDSWTDSLVFEAQSGLPLVAMALSTGAKSSYLYDRETGSYSISEKIALKIGESYEFVLYVALNLEADGASTTIIDLKRHGPKSLTEKSIGWLKSKRVRLKDADLSSLLNRNLFFCYYFALGRSLDSDELIPLTSRSPRYYVSAAFWSRDTFLWSFPAFLMIDQNISRELLVTSFKRYIKHAGEHALYINGTVLYGGFELDQLASYILALKSYLSHSKDYTVLKEESISRGLVALIDIASSHYDQESGLYSSFLDPSDDPVVYPYLTYSNILLQVAFTFLAESAEKLKTGTGYTWVKMAAQLKENISKHCVVDGPNGQMFAWSVDGKGLFQLYDNPPGSLQLLPHYGFCQPADPVFNNTVRWIRSAHNPYFHKDRNFAECGSLHAHKPWPLGACNDLLALNESGKDFCRRAKMDSGFFCETVDPDQGTVATGAAFASGAGFLAYALGTLELVEQEI